MVSEPPPHVKQVPDMTPGLWYVDAETRVRYGAAWLDENYKEWWRTIPLTDDLVMSSHDKCVLARVTHMSFTDLIPSVLTTGEALWYGFTGGFGVSSIQLREAWIDLIADRAGRQAEAVIREVFESTTTHSLLV